MGAPANVLIEGCLIHHCLNAVNGRTDAGAGGGGGDDEPGSPGGCCHAGDRGPPWLAFGLLALVTRRRRRRSDESRYPRPPR